MAASEEPAVEAADTVFRFAARIVGTEDPKDVWQPGATTTSGTGSSSHDRYDADPVLQPVPPPFDRSGWPGMY